MSRDFNNSVLKLLKLEIKLTIWYNNLKPTAVVRRRNAKAFKNLRFLFKNIESIKPPHCYAPSGFAATNAFAFGFMI